MRKREKRVKKELGRRGTTEAGHGWASRQASKRKSKRLTKRAIKRQGGRGR